MRILIIAATLILGGCSQAEAPKIEVHDAWSRATTVPNGPTAAYLTISNDGGEDRLLGVAGLSKASASLHSSAMHDGVMEMRPLPEGIAIPAHDDTQLSPQGTHIMIEGIGPLSPGDELQLSLRFEKSGEVVVPVRVVAPGSR